MRKRSGNPTALSGNVLNPNGLNRSRALKHKTLTEPDGHNDTSYFCYQKKTEHRLPQRKEKATGLPLENIEKDENTQRLQQRLYTCRQVAGLCGVHPKTWRMWSDTGLCPAPLKIGRTNFWRIDEITKWIESGCPKRGR
jgi:predicted DNA-binding transcriptional regulator AlpA